MGAASKICSVILRFLELASASIVAGLVGQFLYYLHLANVGAGSRIIYSEVIAGISIFFSLLFMPPLKYVFYFFPLDFALFICWMVAFGLLANLTVGNDCSSYWYWSTWGYYWGGFWYAIPVNAITPSIVGTAGCAKWRTTLSFSFIGGWCWFISGLLGIYVYTTKYNDTASGTGRWFRGPGSKPGTTSDTLTHEIQPPNV